MSAQNPVQNFVIRAQRAAAKIEAFERTILFDFGEHGKVFADATNNPVTIEHGDDFGETADCQVRTKLPIFEKLLAGELDPMQAMLTGRLKISGDMGAALELAKRLRAANA